MVEDFYLRGKKVPTFNQLHEDISDGKIKGVVIFGPCSSSSISFCIGFIPDGHTTIPDFHYVHAYRDGVHGIINGDPNKLAHISRYGSNFAGVEAIKRIAQYYGVGVESDADGVIIPEPAPEEISQEDQERVDFCLSKCGVGYCRAMTTAKQPGDYPCIEYICAFCKNKDSPIAACKFCRGDTLQQDVGDSKDSKDHKVDVNDLPEDQKPGCFGAIDKGRWQWLRDCKSSSSRGCPWEPRCRQSQVDY